MKRLGSRLLAGAMALGIASGLLVAMPVAAMAQVDCADDAVNMGSKSPVLLVHGLFGKKNMWDSTSQYLRSISNAYIVEPFDYEAHNTKWITDPNIAPKLAETITCLADASRKNGGPGKVIVIGHSMGGLAAQYAATKVPDKVGHVIAIGSPFEGSDHGSAASTLVNAFCVEGLPVTGKLTKRLVTGENCKASLAVHGLSIGSKELAELPAFPPNVTIKAIAGNVTPQMKLGFVTITAKPRNSDLVVGVKSATTRTTSKGAGDGAKTVGCTGFIMIPSMSDASCEHSRLINDPSVQLEVKAGIERYLTSTEKRPPLPPGRKVTLFNKLSFTYLDIWKKGFSTPGTMEDIVDGTTCTASSAECPHIMVINLDSPEARAQYGNNPMAKAAHDCMLEQDESGHKPGQQPKLMSTEVIDGEPVEYYEQTVCPSYLGSNEKAYFWYAKQRGVLIDASSAGLTGSPLVFDQLKAVIANIDWL